MRNHAIRLFIKDLVTLAIAAALGYYITLYGFDAPEFAELGACTAACLPFGWRWASHIITAVSLYGIGIKAVLSVVLGMFAVPVCLLMDLVRVFTSGRRVPA